MSSSDLEQALYQLRDARIALAERSSPDFNERLAALRQWQSQRIAAWHRPLAQRYKGDALLRFLTRSFYLEADWSELTDKPDKIAGRIGRIINDDRPLVIAVRLQHAADTLDADLADALIERSPAGPITAAAYVRAFRDVGQVAIREQQIAWINELVDLLGGYADNRAAYWAFKLAGSPAKAFGMGQTYALLAEGFAAMRETKDLEDATREAVAAQHRLLDRLVGRPVGA
ncbi:hypothetical protein SADO_06602 [Salinisphaera dokdonensis CL-ES53]|uniref:DUF8198 domain-containing protein n=1 Tax=Salinisphaera dokdonensis CL-ES53 TaxID=1304272 RepID=A0ABV2AZ64_9GAMM